MKKREIVRITATHGANLIPVTAVDARLMWSDKRPIKEKAAELKNFKNLPYRRKALCAVLRLSRERRRARTKARRGLLSVPCYLASPFGQLKFDSISS